MSEKTIRLGIVAIAVVLVAAAIDGMVRAWADAETDCRQVQPVGIRP